VRKMKKLRVGILFGGRSGEHEVSLLSAASVLNAIDKNKYEVVPIGITKEGRGEIIRCQWAMRPPEKFQAVTLLCGRPGIGVHRPMSLVGVSTKRERLGLQGNRSLGKNTPSPASLCAEETGLGLAWGPMNPTDYRPVWRLASWWPRASRQLLDSRSPDRP